VASEEAHAQSALRIESHSAMIDETPSLNSSLLTVDGETLDAGNLVTFSSALAAQHTTNTTVGEFIC